jgi:hypothetical protein
MLVSFKPTFSTSPNKVLFVDPDPELGRILQLIRSHNCSWTTSESMNSKSMVLYLQRKGWTALDIHDDLVSTLGDEANVYNTVTEHLADAQIYSADATALLHTIPRHIDESDDAIPRALEEPPWSTGSYLRNFGFLRVIFDGCHIFCRTIRRWHESNVRGPFWRYCAPKRTGLGITL